MSDPDTEQAPDRPADTGASRPDAPHPGPGDAGTGDAGTAAGPRSDEPDEITGDPVDVRTTWGRWAVHGLAALVILLAIGVPLAPVHVDDPVITWPQAGHDPTSTVVPLSPYRPLSLHAAVPCETIRAAARTGPPPAVPGGPGPAALRTEPADAAAPPGDGLTVAPAPTPAPAPGGPAPAAAVLITVSHTVLVTEPLPAGACTYRIDADATGVHILRDTTTLAARPDLLPPVVTELETAATGPATAGLAVQLHADARYQSSPAASKTVLLIAHLAALAGLFALLILRSRRILLRALRRRRIHPPTTATLTRPRWGLVDGVVLLATAVWMIIGPLNVDDSWYLLMARNTRASGYIGNYIYQFNVTENPFSASQYPMQLLGSIGGWSLVLMRLLPALYGLGTWILLRFLLATTLGAAARQRVVRWALLVAHLAWFLAYGITLRPEPLIVLGTAAVWLLVEVARRRGSMTILGAAVGAAALSLTVSPTALIALTPLALALPWVWSWWREHGWHQRTGALLIVAAAATVAVPVGFADATLGDVLESTKVHRWYYRQHPWYEEIVHYQNLLASADTGVWAKRTPVLLAIVALIGVAVAAGRRRGTGGPVARLADQAAVLTALSLVALAFTPTKWVNHFGAVAVPATVLLACAIARGPLPRRAPGALVTALTAGGVVAAAVAFAGPNLWRPFSDWGMPFGDHLAASGSPYQVSLIAPHLGPLFLRSLPLWAVLAVACWLGARLWRRLGGRTVGLTADRGVLAIALTVSTVLLFVVFAYAPVRQYPGWSVAASDASALVGKGCGLADHVVVQVPSPVQLGGPAGAATLTGDTVTAPLPVPNAPAGPGTGARGRQTGPPEGRPGDQIWHDDLDDTPGAPGPRSGVGTVTTPWYPLPGGHAGLHVQLPRTGALTPGVAIDVQIGTGDPAGGVTVTRDVGLPGQPFADDWISADVPLTDADRTATAVRVLAQDTLPGPGTWFAFATPRLTTGKSVGDLVGNQPVFADQVSAALWPCVNQVSVTDGIVQQPAYRLRAGDGLEGAVATNSTFAPNGGTFVAVDRSSRYVELPSAPEVAGVPTLAWGHVERVVPDYPVMQVDEQVGRVTRGGLTRLPTLSGVPYTGRDYIG